MTLIKRFLDAYVSRAGNYHLPMTWMF